MSRLAKNIRTAAFLGLLGATAFLGYEFIQNPNTAAVVENVKTSSVVETVRTTAVTGANIIEEQSGEARKVWQQVDLERKVQDFQDKTRPIGQKITSTVGPKITPNLRSVEPGERRMSMPALILILVFGTVFLLMGKASTGGGRY